MKLIKVLALVLVGAMWLSATAWSQSTNIFRTDIESLEAQTNVLIVKGFGAGPTVSMDGGVLTLHLKESYVPGAGSRLQAVVLDFAEGPVRHQTVIDYSELESLIGALDYIRSVSHDVSGLPGFEVSYQTRAGFRVMGVGNHRQSSVLTYVQFEGCARISLDSDQMMQLRGAISQGRNSLDELRSSK